MSNLSVHFEQSLQARYLIALSHFQDDDTARDELVTRACMIAELLGYEAHQQNIESNPLIESDPRLLKAFHCGCAFAHDADEIGDCFWCNDCTEDPCPIHG